MRPKQPHQRQSVKRTAEPKRDPAAVLAASSFSAGIILLPRRLQRDARALYQMLRAIDDLVDENNSHATERVEAVEAWATGDACAETPETATLSELALRSPLSSEALLDFCKGMRHDISGAPIETETDLETYCHDVAGTVGILLSSLLGTTHPDGERKMAVLGRAMQRTNILRDIDEDRANGRLYIAQSTIKRFGAPLPGGREELLRDQIARADALYVEGVEAIPLLIEGQRAMGLSALLYREILRQIERDGYGRHSGRATVPAWRKQQLISRHAQILQNYLTGSPGARARHKPGQKHARQRNPT